MPSIDKINSALASFDQKDSAPDMDKINTALASFDDGQPQSNPQRQMGKIETLGRNSASILGGLGRTVINTPHNLYQFAADRFKELTPNIPQLGMGPQNFQAPPNPFSTAEALGGGSPDYDYFKAMGIQSNLPAQLVQGGLEFGLPSGVANRFIKGTEIAKGLSAGALSGASQDGGDPNSAILGADAAGLGYGAGALVNAGIKSGAGLYSKTALPGLIKKGLDIFKERIGTPEEGASILQSAFDKKAAAKNAAWKTLNDYTAQIDKKLTPNNYPMTAGGEITSIENVGAKPYTDFIADFEKKATSGTNVEKSNYKEALKFANYIKEEKLIPENFSDLVSLRKKLNERVGDFLKKENLTMANRETQDFVRGLKDKLTDTIESDAVQRIIPAEMRNQFKGLWENANKLHQDFKAFEKKTPNASKGTGALKEAVRSGDFSKPELLKNFEGSEGFKQLSKLVGGEDAARRAMKNYGFGNLKKEGVTLQGKYNKQTPDTRDRLFKGSPEQPYLQAANPISEKYGMPKKHQALTGHLISAAGGTLIGAPALHYGAGIPWERAAEVAALGTLGAKGAIAKAATPQWANNAFRLSQADLKNLGIYTQPAIAQAIGQKR